MSAYSPQVSPIPSPHLPASLLDALSDAVVLPPDPRARAAVICGVVDEINASLAWLHSDGVGDDDEMDSLRHLMLAADAHLVAMTDRHGPSRTLTTRLQEPR